MAGTSPGRQSGETAKNERRVPEGRQADPGKLSVVPPGLWDVNCSSTMDLRPWLSHAMPSAFDIATLKSTSEGCVPLIPIPSAASQPPACNLRCPRREPSPSGITTHQAHVLPDSARDATSTRYAAPAADPHHRCRWISERRLREVRHANDLCR